MTKRKLNKSATVYVAGHTGLVGSAIMSKLEDGGYKNIITQTSHELDLRDPAAVRAFFDKELPEYVFLCAARVGGIVANNHYRADFIYDNLMIQSNVIHESFQAGVQKLLFLGSTCVYPKNAPQPIAESALLSGELEYTNEPYAIAKIAGMKMCESYNIQHGTNFISVMPTNLYGPHDNFNLETSHVLPALIRKFYLASMLEKQKTEMVRNDLNKRPIQNITGASNWSDILNILSQYGITWHNNQYCVEIWGTGKPLREFLHVNDMAEACVFLMENYNFSDLTPDEPPIKNTHINIGTGQEISIASLALMIKELTKFSGEIIFNPNKPDGTMQKLSDITKLTNLGWQHRISLKHGIRRILASYANLD